MAARAAAFRRIWPPPSSMLPAGHSQLAINNMVSTIDELMASVLQLDEMNWFYAKPAV